MSHTTVDLWSQMVGHNPDVNFVVNSLLNCWHLLHFSLQHTLRGLFEMDFWLCQIVLTLFFCHSTRVQWRNPKDLRQTEAGIESFSVGFLTDPHGQSGFLSTQWIYIFIYNYLFVHNLIVLFNCRTQFNRDAMRCLFHFHSSFKALPLTAKPLPLTIKPLPYTTKPLPHTHMATPC